MSRVPNRRSRRLVNKRYQLGIAWRMMIAYFLFLLGGLLLLFAPSMFVVATGKEISVVEPAARELLVLHERVWPAVVFIGAGVFVYTLVLSHRIAGPIHRINEVLKGMIEGRYPDRITLRRGDHFHTTAALLTELSRKLARETEAAGGGGPGGAGSGAP